MSKGILYLIPNFLGIGNKDDVTLNQLAIIRQLKEFIVESEKEARAYLKAIEHPLPQSNFVFHLINEHTRDREDLTPFFKTCMKGESIGLLSDAGIPCVADPGNRAVVFAHSNGIRVKPFSGASSIYMALMASGFNGQNFCFHGYLPIEHALQIKKVKTMEQAAAASGQTQIFMETPYRNERLLEVLIKTLKPNTKLCIACNIMNEKEEIVSKPIVNWIPMEMNLHKNPAIFLINV